MSFKQAGGFPPELSTSCASVAGCSDMVSLSLYSTVCCRVMFCTYCWYPPGRSKGGKSRAEDLGHEGYQEMGKKGGLSTSDKSGGERAEEEGIEIDESKYTKAGKGGGD